MQRRPISAEKAKEWAEDLCSRAEYSSGEMRLKLIRKGLQRAEAEKIVTALLKTRFIDDSRFARAFVRDKVGYSRWGKNKVAMALMAKGVSRDVASEAISEIDEDEYIEGLAQLLESKMRSVGATPDNLGYEARAKLYRFAASRGFLSSDIGKALNRLVR